MVVENKLVYLLSECQVKGQEAKTACSFVKGRNDMQKNDAKLFAKLDLSYRSSTSRQVLRYIEISAGKKRHSANP